MNRTSKINYTKLAYVLLIGCSLLYSLVVSGFLDKEIRELVDCSIKYGFFVGYGVWVLGMVIANAIGYRRFFQGEDAKNYPGSNRLIAALRILLQTLIKAAESSVVSPMIVYRKMTGQGNRWNRLVSGIEVYVMRPLASILSLIILTILSPLVILPFAVFAHVKREQGEQGEEILSVACIAGSDPSRSSFLRAFALALGNVSVSPWRIIGAPQINKSKNNPKYHYIELLLKKNSNPAKVKPSLRIQVCDFEGSDHASLQTLDSMPFFRSMSGVVFIVEESTDSRSFSATFDRWYELMNSAHKDDLKKLKCFVVICPNGKGSIFDGARELVPNAGKTDCCEFLREHRLAEIIEKTALFRKTEFFAVSSDPNELDECPGVYALAKKMLQYIPC